MMSLIGVGCLLIIFGPLIWAGWIEKEEELIPHYHGNVNMEDTTIKLLTHAGE